ncbi:MAG: S1C family serine protease [Pseudomonadota bacterium]|nr:S1C family serine protease [Pseudomonadota bacterium]
MTDENNVRSQGNGFNDLEISEKEIEKKLRSVVSVTTTIPDHAQTANILGTKRSGNGVLINQMGLIVTIGYLLAEAKQIWITTAHGETVTADTVLYDYESGLGLLKPLKPISIPAIGIANQNHKVNSGDKGYLLAGFGGLEQTINVDIASCDSFTGYWEYVLDRAFYTAPAHPSWGGAALLNKKGELTGIGSLYLENPPASKKEFSGNLCVPIDALWPLFSEIKENGNVKNKERPYLGFFVSVVENQFVVLGLYNSSPAALAGIKAGDIIKSINGVVPVALSELFKLIWKAGPAGTVISIEIESGDKHTIIDVVSAERKAIWISPTLH